MSDIRISTMTLGHKCEYQFVTLQTSDKIPLDAGLMHSRAIALLSD